MPKSFIRKSRASGSDLRKIERIIRAGWQPGQPYFRYSLYGRQARLRDIARKGAQFHEQF